MHGIKCINIYIHKDAYPTDTIPTDSMHIMLCQKTKQAFFGNVFLRKKRTKHPTTENPVKKEETKTHCSFNGDTVVGHRESGI